MKLLQRILPLLLCVCPQLASSDIQSLTVLNAPKGGPSFYTFAFISEASHIAISTSGGVSVWDITSGENLLQFTAPMALGISKAVFSPDGKWIATPEKNAVVNIRDSRDGNIVKTWTVPPNLPEPLTDPFLQTLDFSPDSSQLLISTYPNKVYLWSWETDQTQVVVDEGPYYIQFTPDGENALMQDNNQQTMIVSLKDGRVTRKYKGVMSILSSNGGLIHYLESIMDPLSNSPSQYSIHSVSALTGEESYTSPERKLPLIGIGTIRVSPRGSIMAVVDLESKQDPFRIPLLDWKRDLKLEELVFTNSKKPFLCDFSPNGRYFAANQGDALSVFDVSSLASGVQNAGVHEGKKNSNISNKKAKGRK